ncbi:competence type IV pilus minor pilin ComGG [Bacillus sp. FJAT-47783]|uniref:competence type IV pilus minor pilin ComGG n=1 Tax=Bacillus sp. FJAT-47783 TaxID=2922712 RepID=UPI001FAC47CC|nr:competence type IV pilus minor pilin ComGG [Bacillus sp. FJAT-47783]
MNEKGYIFPLTLFIAFLSLFIATTNVTIYIRDLAFYEDTIEFYLVENLTQVAIQHSVMHLVDGTNETLQTPNGTVSYNVKRIDEKIMDVSVSCTTINGTDYDFSYQYDNVENRIVYWNIQYPYST